MILAELKKRKRAIILLSILGLIVGASGVLMAPTKSWSSSIDFPTANVQFKTTSAANSVVAGISLSEIYSESFPTFTRHYYWSKANSTSLLDTSIGLSPSDIAFTGISAADINNLTMYQIDNQYVWSMEEQAFGENGKPFLVNNTYFHLDLTSLTSYTSTLKQGQNDLIISFDTPNWIPEANFSLCMKTNKQALCLDPTVSSCPTTLAGAGVYTLTNSISSSGADCIRFGASNILLDCAGFNITATSGRAIYGQNYTNATVFDCNITDTSSTGISFLNYSVVNVTNNTVYDLSSGAITNFINVSNLTVTNNYLRTGNLAGGNGLTGCQSVNWSYNTHWGSSSIGAIGLFRWTGTAPNKGCINVTIHGNSMNRWQATASTAQMVYLDAPLPAPVNVNVSYNSISQTAQIGVQVQSDGNIVQGNSVSLTGTPNLNTCCYTFNSATQMTALTIKDNTCTTTLGGDGFCLTSVLNPVFQRNNVTTTGASWNATRFSNVTALVENGSFSLTSGAGSYVVGTASSVTFLNVSGLNSYGSEFLDAASNATIKWYYQGFVQNASNVGLTGATQNVTYSNGTNLYNQTTTNGAVPMQNLTECFVNSAGRTNSTPYNIYSNSSGNYVANTTLNLPVIAGLNWTVTLAFGGTSSSCTWSGAGDWHITQDCILTTDTNLTTNSLYIDNGTTILQGANITAKHWYTNASIARYKLNQSAVKRVGG